MTDLDVTTDVEFSDVDGEALPLTRCVCGKLFDSWDIIVGVYRDHPWTCTRCKRQLYFENNIRVYQVVEP